LIYHNFSSFNTLIAELSKNVLISPFAGVGSTRKWVYSIAIEAMTGFPPVFQIGYFDIRALTIGTGPVCKPSNTTDGITASSPNLF